MNRIRIWMANQLLRNGVGHHLGYNLALADAVLRAGACPHLVVHREFREPVPRDVGVHHLFRTDYRADPPAWAASNHRLLSFLEGWCSRRFAADLSRFPEVGEGDVVLAQMLAPRHLTRWLRWFGAQNGAAALVLHLGYRPERFSGQYLRRLIASVPPARRQRLFFVTDSEKLCPAFGELLGESVHYLPHVVSYPITPVVRAVPSDGPMNVFVPGNARREKGFVESVESARLLSSPDGACGFNFTIQCHEPDLACGRFLESLSSPPCIEWIAQPLANDAYVRKLAETDIVLLPYHLDCYAARTSGVFAEARVAGIPVLTTRGSWAGDRIAREGGGWLAPERDAQALASVLQNCRSTLAQAKSEAISIAESAMKEFDRDNFVAKLTSLVSGGTVS